MDGVKDSRFRLVKWELALAGASYHSSALRAASHREVHVVYYRADRLDAAPIGGAVRTGAYAPCSRAFLWFGQSVSMAAGPSCWSRASVRKPASRQYRQESAAGKVLAHGFHAQVGP